jgi:hypothetical protein
LKPINLRRPKPNTGPQTPAHQEESRLVERFPRLTVEQKMNIGIILGNHGELRGNAGVEEIVNLINLKLMILTALKTYFDRLNRDGSVTRRPGHLHTRDD